MINKIFNRTIQFFIFFFISITAFGQSGYTLIDTCFHISGGYDTTFSRTILITTNTGSYEIIQSMASYDTNWTTTISSNVILYNTYNLYDSLNRIIETDRLRDSATTWNFYHRTLFSYDSSGRICDSLEQDYSGNAWVNTAEWKWQKDASGNFTYNESMHWINGLLLNDYREEWYYDALLRDTLEINYTGDTSLWIPLSRIQTVYGLFGIIDHFQLSWTGTSWNNIDRTQYFFQALNEDTLDIFFTGNGTQWDTNYVIRNSFDTSGNKIYSRTTDYIGMIWVDREQSFFTYDLLQHSMTELRQSADSSGWTNVFRDSVYDDGMGDVEINYYSWNGSSWVCSQFDYTNGDHHLTGFLDSDCNVDGIMIDQTHSYDSAGRLIYYDYDGHAGSSYGSGSYFYDNNGFLYAENSFGSSMGGIINVNNCYHYIPLVFSADQSDYNFCAGDSLNIITHVFGGAYVYNYLWKFNNQILPDTTPTLSSIAQNHSGWYSMTVTDTARNFYTDSIFVAIHPDPVLGNDTIICRNTSVTLNPGLFATYQWQDGSTTPTFSATSILPDTILYWVRVNDTTGCSNTDSITVIFDVCQSVNELNNHELKIYPDPIMHGEEIKIVSDKLSKFILIKSTTGQILFETIGKNISTLNPYLKPGIYYISFYYDDNVITKRIIIL